MLSLREFRTKNKGFADLLNYAAFIDEGAILNKDGSLMTACCFQGEDLDSATEDELAIMSEQINSALTKLGTGWMLNVDSLRLPAMSYVGAQVCSFPSRVTALIDEERRRQYEKEGAHYENIYILTLTYLPPPDINAKLVSVFVEDDRKKGKVFDYNELLSRYKNTVAEVFASLAFRLTVTPMSSEEFLTFLHSCITGEVHTVHVPKIPMYLDVILGCRDFKGGFYPAVGQQHLRVVTIAGYPAESTPGMLDALNRLSIPYRWSTRFIILDPVDALTQLKTYRRNWIQKRSTILSMLKGQMGAGESRYENGDAVQMSDDANDAYTEASEGRVRFGYHTLTVVCHAVSQEEADFRAGEIVKVLNNLGFAAFVETTNAVDAFLGSLPGHGYPNVRRPLIHTGNLADMLPLTWVWPGAAVHPCDLYPPNSPPLFYGATSGSTPFRVSLHCGDLGHTLMLGPPGSGKSTILGLIAAQQFRYPNAQVFMFDKGMSAYILTKACGGLHYEIAGEGQTLAFCPLGDCSSEQDRAWAKEWVELLVLLQLSQGESLSPQERGEISRGVDNLLNNTDSPEQRTLTALNTTIQNPKIRAAIDYYTLQGSLGELLDASSDSLRTSNFQVFEIEHLMNKGEKAVIPVLLYLFYKLEKRFDGKPTLLILDEAWIMLRHPLFREKIREWLKVLRKANVAVVFATQSVGDVMNSPIADVLIESCPTKILLPNPDARTEVSAAFYRQMGLNTRQIDNLARAIKKKDYYLMSSDGKRLFDLRLGPVTLAFVGTNAKRDIPIVNELQAQYGEEWIQAWLRKRGATDKWIQDWFATY